MFGLSKRERTEEALRRGTAAALTGGFLHNTEVEKLGLNKAATVWIYTESQIHQIFALGIIYSNSAITSEPWATAAFFNDTVSNTLTQHERANGLSPGTVTSFLFKRIDEFSRIDRQFLAAGQHYLDTATKANDRDPKTDIKRVCVLLREATEAYFQAAQRMFQ